jgi:5-oxoprolinase (ATP-hydrolysing)
VIRKIRFLEAMTATIVSSRRSIAPFGLHGGGAGACGEQYVERRDGTAATLPASASVTMQAGDAFIIKTPGGGGYGGA